MHVVYNVMYMRMVNNSNNVMYIAQIATKEKEGKNRQNQACKYNVFLLFRWSDIKNNNNKTTPTEFDDPLPHTPMNSAGWG